MPTLNWLSRDEDVKAINKIPYRLLEEVPELSYGKLDTSNMLIQGDNLEALKALLPFYAGQVKCIYIDPPFNTGQAFEHYDDNIEHSIWLGMMFSRLQLLNELLSEKGTIAIHLDQEEFAYCMTIMDEIFGRKNRISIVTFKQSSVSGPKAINPGVVSTCSYLMLYAKSKSNWESNKVFRPRNRDARYASFIQNRDLDMQDWSVIPLAQAIEEHFNLSIKDLKSKFNTKYEEKIHQFVLNNKKAIIRTARVKPKDIREEARPYLQSSVETPNKFFVFEREGQSNQYFRNGEQVAFYSSKVKEIDGIEVTAERVSDLWEDLLSNNLHKEGDVRFPKGKKPEALIKRVFELFTNEGDLVLDSFLGSGTTAAVAHKMNLQYIGIEMGNQAESHCRFRLSKVVDGDSSGISKAVKWQGGGGFKFYRLGANAFDETGKICADINFPVLASHIWFSETSAPWNRIENTPVLGIYEDKAYALLYNGILRDRRPQGGNVLTSKTLRIIRDDISKLDSNFSGETIVYGESSRIGTSRLKAENIVFKQTPYDVKAR